MWLRRADGTEWVVDNADVYAKCLREGFLPIEAPTSQTPVVVDEPAPAEPTPKSVPTPAPMKGRMHQHGRA